MAAIKKKRRSGTTDSVVEAKLSECLAELEDHLNAHCVVVMGPMHYGIDDAVRDVVETRVQKAPKRRRLVVIVETPGGYIEVVQRIVQVFRSHYKQVDFVVPNHAMSAGTVLVLSGDSIWMDYYSVLGPIDPQVQSSTGRSVAALGYLEKYSELIEASKTGSLTTAQMAFLIQKFDPAELYAYEQAREMSVDLLTEWLAKYKFKNWKITEKRGLTVTAAMRKDRAKEIAAELNKTDKWHSHGHGISMEVLKKKLNLVIDDLAEDAELYGMIKEYYCLLKHYMARTGQTFTIRSIAQYVMGHKNG